MNIKALQNLGLKDYEIVGRLQEARAKNLNEVAFMLPNGRKVTVKLNQLNPDCIMDDAWWVRN
ncbi:MAG: hypothetical protein CMH61_02540 [Nanoarchaeota archaeon]|nr:hypothetical protein [Nanoarchaeota archaeon]|tara:strand:- start:64 stop:252 length:189 start_codon:yes stop_codon:yes gene_type:complete